MSNGFKITVPFKSTGHFRDLRIWLIDNVAVSDYLILGADVHGLSYTKVVWFKYEKDAIMFALRWI
jgi:hypothetical protein